MTLPSNLKLKLKRLEQCRENLADALLQEMVRAAHRAGIVKMEFLLVTTYYNEAGNEVENAELDALEGIYLREICKYGFEDIWERGKGWTQRKDTDDDGDHSG